MGNLLWALELLQQYENFFGICSPVCGSSAWWLYGGANGDLLQEDLCHTLCLPGLLQPEPLSPGQNTADPCLPRRHSNHNGRSDSVSVGSLGPGVHKVLFEPSKHLWWVWGLILNAISPLLPSSWRGGGIFFWWDPTFSCQWLFSS